MENAPHTPEQIQEKISALSQEIIALEKKLTGVHQETGSDSIDDNSQEAVLDDQSRTFILDTIAKKREEMSRLHDLIVTQ
jgi:hypothetical protein